MNLTRELLQIVLNDSELQSALLEYEDYSQIDLKDLKNLNEHDLNHLKDGITYVAKNYFPIIRTYETHLLFETSPDPITIYGVDGIYAVIYQEIGFEDVTTPTNVQPAPEPKPEPAAKEEPKVQSQAIPGF